MKRILILAALFLAIGTFASQAQAQIGYEHGYGFGLGYNFGFPTIGRCYYQREDLPYFAKFPPVYYSHIVRRPYGVSPYAAPPGILPVEMSAHRVAREPLTIVNPFYKDEASHSGQEAVKSDQAADQAPMIAPTEAKAAEETAPSEKSEAPPASVLDTPAESTPPVSPPTEGAGASESKDSGGE